MRKVRCGLLAALVLLIVLFSLTPDASANVPETRLSSRRAHETGALAAPRPAQTFNMPASSESDRTTRVLWKHTRFLPLFSYAAEALFCPARRFARPGADMRGRACSLRHLIAHPRQGPPFYAIFPAQ